VLDTVRADAVHAYGQPYPTTPQVDAIAAAGVRFDDVTASGSWTWPSHAALFTGEPPWVSGAHAAPADGGLPLREETLRVTPMRTDLPTLAERFGAAGYATAAVVANRLLAPRLGLTRGFATVEHLEDDAAVAARALAAMDTAEPLFLFVNLMAAHGPYERTSAPWSARHDLDDHPWTAPWRDGQTLSLHRGGQDGVVAWLRGDLEIPADGMALLHDLYLGEVQAADRTLNRILAAWTARHPSGIVAVTSDHGEYFGEHGLLEHSGTVYDEVVAVPLVLFAPGLPAGTVIESPAQLRDLHPTLLALAGVDTTPWSLRDLVAGTPRPGPITAAAWPRVHWRRDVGGKLSQGWRLLRDGDRRVYVGTDGDIEGDAALADAARAEIPMDLTRGAGVAVSTDELEALRALGYVE